jgi:hypothetical protein
VSSNWHREFESHRLRQRFLTRKNMKPNKTFKLPKSTKRMLALFKFSDADQRHAFKRIMIDAHLTSSVRPAREKSEK